MIAEFGLVFFIISITLSFLLFLNPLINFKDKVSFLDDLDIIKIFDLMFFSIFASLFVGFFTSGR